MDVFAHRRWMYNMNHPNRMGMRKEFVKGVKEFIAYAKSLPTFQRDGTVRCPCVRCKCTHLMPPEQVNLHLYRKGFMENYFVWSFHGETDVTSNYAVGKSSHQSNDHNDVQESRVNEMVRDAFGMNDVHDHDQNVEQPPNEEAQHFYDQLHATSRPLREGSKRRNKRAYTQDEVFEHTQKYRAKEGESEEDRRLVDPRSETSHAHHRQMLAELPADQQLTPKEREKMWLASIGGVRRGHVYGMTGSSQTIFHRVESGHRGIGTSAGAEALNREGLKALQEQVTRLTQSIESERAEKEKLKRAPDNQSTKIERLEAQMAVVIGKCAYRKFKQPIPHYSSEDESEDEQVI